MRSNAPRLFPVLLAAPSGGSGHLPEGVFTKIPNDLSRQDRCGAKLWHVQMFTEEPTGRCREQFMKSEPDWLFGLLMLVTAMAYSTAATAQSAAPQATNGQEITPAGNELTWPREFVDKGTKVDIYQPEIEKWEGTDFETRSAVGITSAESNAPVYGVSWMKARVHVDKTARIVTLNDIQVTRAIFPSTPGSQKRYLALIRKHVPTIAKTVALDHLEASYAISEAVKKAQAVPVRNDPPRIVYSTTPSLLVLLDGPPALRPMPGLNVERVINSRALILMVGVEYYLYASDHWYQAADVSGPWGLAASAPPELEAPNRRQLRVKAQI